jgi:hypothetical protein
MAARSDRQPGEISPAERRARVRRAVRVAGKLGFVGRVEYRHVFSSAGGAQYGVAASPEQDLLIVYADAFERDADPADFSLEGILAHERGHQLLLRHERLGRLVGGQITPGSEEILASLLGSLVAESAPDREALALKALAEMITRGMEAEHAVRLMGRLRALLEKFL